MILSTSRYSDAEYIMFGPGIHLLTPSTCRASSSPVSPIGQRHDGWSLVLRDRCLNPFRPLEGTTTVNHASD